ncbi:MAG: hypothetical protein RIG68_09365 [Imperialibacter sp.]
MESSSGAFNEITFKENSDGRTFEARFTDPIGKDVVETFGKIVTSRQLLFSSDSSQSADLKDNTIDVTDTSLEEIEKKNDGKQEKISDSAKGYPSLDTIAIKNLPANESEWIVVYAFYSSDFGVKTFTRQNLIEAYESSRRKNKKRISQLTPYLNATVKSGDVNPLGDGIYSLLDNGIERAKEIVQRKNGSPGKRQKLSSKTVNKPKEKPQNLTTKKTLAKNVVQEKFDTHSGEKTLGKFYEDKTPGKNTGKRILTIAYYITKILGQNSFSDGNIDYAYRVLQLDKRPKHLRQQIINFKNSKAWFEEGENGSWRLSRHGEIYVEDNW